MNALVETLLTALALLTSASLCSQRRLELDARAPTDGQLRADRRRELTIDATARVQ